MIDGTERPSPFYPPRSLETSKHAADRLWHYFAEFLRPPRTRFQFSQLSIRPRGFALANRRHNKQYDLTNN